jgi:GrpB-like predicted nucleotidyltransferase (UPF0157 family)
VDDAAFDAWARRRHAGDESATLLDLYDAVARNRGLEARELTADERAALSARALHVMDATFELISDTERGIEPIELVPYDPRWPAQFEEWKARILSVLQPRRIDHVGSTSVPGLAAKPIVDVQISIDDIRVEGAYVPAIESIGVQLRSRDAQHRYFRPFAGWPRDVHIHVCNAGSPWERRHLLFVAFLRTDVTARENYVREKLQAADQWADDRIAYTEAKDEVIREINDRAEEWAREVGWTP